MTVDCDVREPDAEELAAMRVRQGLVELIAAIATRQVVKASVVQMLGGKITPGMWKVVADTLEMVDRETATLEPAQVEAIRLRVETLAEDATYWRVDIDDPYFDCAELYVAPVVRVVVPSGRTSAPRRRRRRHAGARARSPAGRLDDDHELARLGLEAVA
jgi:hypothetical protein